MKPGPLVSNYIGLQIANQEIKQKYKNCEYCVASSYILERFENYTWFIIPLVAFFESFLLSYLSVYLITLSFCWYPFWWVMVNNRSAVKSNWRSNGILTTGNFPNTEKLHIKLLLKYFIWVFYEAFLQIINIELLEVMLECVIYLS